MREKIKCNSCGSMEIDIITGLGNKVSYDKNGNYIGRITFALEKNIQCRKCGMKLQKSS
jgi:ribosomal protein S27E